MAETQSPIQALTANIQERQQNATDITALMNQLGQSVLAQTNAQKESGTVIGGNLQTAESFALEQKARLEAKTQLREFAGTMDYNKLSIDIAAQSAAETRRMMQTANTIANKSQVSFWDSPVTALENAFTLPWDEQALEGSKQKLDMLSTAQNQMDARIKGAAVSTDLLKQDIDENSLATLNSAFANRLKVQAEEGNQKVIANRLDAITAITRADSATMDAILKKQQFVNSEEDRALKREQLAAARTQRELLNSQKLEQQAGRQAAIDTVKIGMKREGLTPPDDAQIMIGLTQDKNTPVGKIYGSFYERGLLARVGANPADGETPEERDTYRKSIGWKPQTPQEELLARLDSEAWGAAKGKNKDKTAANAEAAKLIEGKLLNWQSNVVPGDKSNPLAPPSYAALSAFTGLQRTPGWTAIAPLVTGEKKDEPIHPQVVFNSLERAIVERKITPNQAAQTFSTLYKGILTNANEQSSAAKLLGTNFKEYNVNVETGSLAGNLAKQAGAATFATGVAGELIPGVQIPATALAVGGAALYGTGTLMSGTSSVNAAGDPAKILLMFNKAVSAHMGLQVNISGERTAGFYPPILQSTLLKEQGVK